jgi:hypothetical protein
MKVMVVVQTEDGIRQYSAEYQTVDWRQVMNDVRKGRHVVGPGNVATVRLEGDAHGFLVGNEKDTGAWLEKRFTDWRKSHSA